MKARSDLLFAHWCSSILYKRMWHARFGAGAVYQQVLLYKYRVNCVTEGSTYCVLQPYDATKGEQEELRKTVLVYQGLAGWSCNLTYSCNLMYMMKPLQHQQFQSQWSESPYSLLCVDCKTWRWSCVDSAVQISYLQLPPPTWGKHPLCIWTIYEHGKWQPKEQFQWVDKYDFTIQYMV